MSFSQTSPFGAGSQFTDMTAAVSTGKSLVIKQRKELVEVFLGFETKNQYLVFDSTGVPCGTIVEEGGGIVSILKRMILRSHRPFVINVFDGAGKCILVFRRKFFFIFSDVEVFTPDGQRLGTAHRRFGIFHKIYDLKDQSGGTFARVKSAIFKIWTFAIRDNDGREVARISKKWSGALKEMFMDADNFQVDFGTASWDARQRAVVLAVAISIDFDFFDNNN